MALGAGAVWLDKKQKGFSEVKGQSKITPYIILNHCMRIFQLWFLFLDAFQGLKEQQ